MNEETQLLPCPFCGGTTHETCMTDMYEVACHQCKSSTGLYATLEEAEAAWNRRGAADARLRDMLSSCAALLETLAEDAEKDQRIADWSMMSVMAEDVRKLPTANVPPQVNEAVTFDHKQQADNYLAALLGYSGGFYGAAIKAGMSAAETVGPVAHIERAARELHRLALASPSPGTATAGASDQSGEAKPLTIVYTNWRGETAERRIVPISMWFGSTDWHPAPQWLVKALDVDKGEERDLAWNGIDFQGDGPASASDQSRVERLETALSDIAAERERQKSVEGWTTEHDDGHVDSELGRAAAAYALFAASPKRFTALARAMRDMIPSVWPWDAGWWKPSDKNRRNLVKAGALIVAEIERLDRQALGDRS